MNEFISMGAIILLLVVVYCLEKAYKSFNAAIIIMGYDYKYRTSEYPIFTKKQIFDVELEKDAADERYVEKEGSLEELIEKAEKEIVKTKPHKKWEPSTELTSEYKEYYKPLAEYGTYRDKADLMRSINTRARLGGDLEKLQDEADDLMFSDRPIIIGKLNLYLDKWVKSVKDEFMKKQ